MRVIGKIFVTGFRFGKRVLINIGTYTQIGRKKDKTMETTQPNDVIVRALDGVMSTCTDSVACCDTVEDFVSEITRRMDNLQDAIDQDIIKTPKDAFLWLHTHPSISVTSPISGFIGRCVEEYHSIRHHRRQTIQTTDFKWYYDMDFQKDSDWLRITGLFKLKKVEMTPKEDALLGMFGKFQAEQMFKVTCDFRQWNYIDPETLKNDDEVVPVAKWEDFAEVAYTRITYVAPGGWAAVVGMFKVSS